MSDEQAMVYILDDDVRIREALTAFVSSLGHEVKTFANAAEYLTFSRYDRPSCLILDLKLPDLTGLEVQSKLSGNGELPIIFLTGFGDVSLAMKAGAASFLCKPFDERELIEAIDEAIQADRAARARSAELQNLKGRYETLTQRERDVLPFVISGFLNKQTANELARSEITIRVHRGQIMRKMQASSLAELVHLAGQLDIPIQRDNWQTRIASVAS